MKMRGLVWFAAAVMTFASVPAVAVEAGSWLVRGGFHSVRPKSDNGNVAALAADLEVDSAEQLTFNITYMFTEQLGLEVLAALPFKHDIDIGGANLAETKHLPPTISMVYRFSKDAPVNFYAGLGVNVTLFFEEDTKGALAGTELELDTSVGPAAVIGVDFKLNDRWFLNADVRYMDIDTDAKVTAPGLSLKESVEIDPWAFGLNVGYRF